MAEAWHGSLAIDTSFFATIGISNWRSLLDICMEVNGDDVSANVVAVLDGR